MRRYRNTLPPGRDRVLKTRDETRVHLHELRARPETLTRIVGVLGRVFDGTRPRRRSTTSHLLGP
jgi:hypothetical protein